MLKFTEQRKTPGMTSKKTLLSLKGKSRFCVNLDETKADMVQLQRDGTKKNVKKKYLMCQEATPNLSLHNLKI